MGYPTWLCIAAVSVAAAALAILIAGSAAITSPAVVLPAVAVVATLVQLIARLCQRWGAPGWLARLMAGAAAMLSAHCLRGGAAGLDPWLVTVGGLVPLLPGILSVRVMADLLRGHLRSAAGRALETVGSAAPLAVGVALMAWAVRLG